MQLSTSSTPSIGYHTTGSTVGGTTTHDLISHSIKSSASLSSSSSTSSSCSSSSSGSGGDLMGANTTTSMNISSNITSTSNQQRETMHEIEMLSKLIAIADKHTSIERTNELEFIRTTLIEAHAQFWPTTMEKIRRRYAERPPVRVTGNSLPMMTMMNGGVGGNDHHAYRECFAEAMVPLIMQVVKFCKKIPGFEQIAQPDQVQLLKQGSFEVICVNSFLLVDAHNRLMLTPDMEYLMDS